MSDSLPLAIVQSDLHWEDPQANLEMFYDKIDSIGEEADLIVFMGGRKARNRKQSIRVEGAVGESRITGHPLHLEMALFTALKIRVAPYPEDWSISVGVERAGDIATVEFLEDSDSPRPELVLDQGNPWQVLENLVSDLGGELEAIAAGRGIRISFKAA